MSGELDLIFFNKIIEQHGQHASELAIEFV